MNKVISIIMPVLNEEPHIEKVVTSLLQQELPDFELEVLLIDGMSTDRTREIIEAMAAKDSRIHLHVNKRRKTPFAFNIGLREARGDLICIMGAHTVYDKDYIKVCREEMIANDAVGVASRTFYYPANDSAQAQWVSWVYGSAFGISGSSVRLQPEGYVDTVSYPVFVKKVLLDLGGYNELLARNQDNDMNYRIHQAGYKMYCTHKTNSYYETQKTAKSLFKYAIRTGRGNAISIKVNAKSLSLRHHIPGIFTGAVLLGVLFLIVALVSGSLLWWGLAAFFLSSLVLHLVVGTLVALKILLESKKLSALAMPFIFLIFHISYGLGIFYGIFMDKPDQWVEGYV